MKSKKLVVEDTTIKEEVKRIRKQRNKDDFKVLKFDKDASVSETVTKSILERNDSSDILKRYASIKIKLHKQTKNLNIFQSMYNELKQMNESKTLSIYSFIYLNWGENIKNDNAEGPCLTLYIKNYGHIKRNIIYSMNEEYYYGLFKMFNYMLLKYYSNFNKLELNTLTKLVKKTYETLDLVYDTMSVDFVDSLLYTSKSTIEYILTIDNEYIKDYLRRTLQYFEYNLIAMLEEDLDLMLEKKELVLLKCLKLNYTKNKTSICLFRIINNVKLNKNYFVDFNTIDEFQLYRINEVFFEYIKEIINKHFADSKGKIFNKIDKVLEMVV